MWGFAEKDVSAVSATAFGFITDQFMKMDLGSIKRAHGSFLCPLCACMRACKRGSGSEITCWACLYRLPGRIPRGLLELL